ncbi:class A beta-lactamase-related serine hydrolase [Flavihumibacter sediminis]|nr:class A beta-lactamase-related serine hydrolase [Flavihumibacter sediminis]
MTALLTFACMALSPIDTTDLKQKIVAEFNKQPQAVFAVAVKDLSSGETFLYNDQLEFHAASTMKTPVLVEAYKQAKEGKFSLSDSMLVKNSFESIVDGSLYSLDSTDDSEKDLYSKIGARLPISDLLYRMITKSSNLATNLIIDLVKATNVNASMRKLGASKIQVLRGVEDGKAFAKGLNNTTTAYDLMLIMEAIANGTAVDKNSSEGMIKVLMDQYFRDIILAKLPADVKAATKSGNITAVCHDSGIVFLPDGRKYVIVLLSKGIPQQSVATEILSTVSRIVYDHLQ